MKKLKVTIAFMNGFESKTRFMEKWYKITEGCIPEFNDSYFWWQV